MDRDEILRLGPALETFLEEFRPCAAAPTRRLIAAYVRGQLGPLPRKSVRPIARDAGIATRTLQELLSLHKWDDGLLGRLVLGRAARHWGGRPAVGLLGLRACAKRGDKTPGVARQRSPASGRVENCCVIVQLGGTGAGLRCGLGSALFLPESWFSDPARRRTGGVPDGVRFRAPAELAFALVRAAEAAGIRFSCLYGGPELGADPEFLGAVSSGGRCGVFDAAAPTKVRGWRPVSLPPAFGAGASTVLTNAPPGFSPEPLAGIVAEARRARESLSHDARAVGLDHFEVRTFRSLQRHLTLSAASLLFLAEQRTPPDKSDGHFHPGAGVAL